MKAKEYRELIQQFLENHSFEADDLAKKYDKIFLAEIEHMEKGLFKILEDFWEDVDAYSPLWEPEDLNEFRINEDTLRKEAVDTLEKLDKYISDHPEEIGNIID